MQSRRTTRRRLRIGELAEATGLTVRTLRHYERVGLLPSPSRTAGRQRVYDERDVRRLYRIRALRDMGLSLAEIARTLRDGEPPLGELVRAHLRDVDAEIARLRRLRTQLAHAATQADRGEDVEVLLLTLEAMAHVSRRAEARAETPKAARDGARAWRALGVALRACLDAGEPPSSPRPQALAAKARERIAAFAGGDAETLSALAHLRRAAPPAELAGWTPELFRYLDHALVGRERRRKETT